MNAKTVIVMTKTDQDRVRGVMVSFMNKACEKVSRRPLSLRTILTAEEAAQLYEQQSGVRFVRQVDSSEDVAGVHRLAREGEGMVRTAEG